MNKFKQLVEKEEKQQRINISNWLNRMLERQNAHYIGHCNGSVTWFLRWLVSVRGISSHRKQEHVIVSIRRIIRLYNASETAWALIVQNKLREWYQGFASHQLFREEGFGKR